MDWDRAEIADFTVDYLLKAPPTGATFADVPAAAAKPKNYATWEKDFTQWLGAVAIDRVVQELAREGGVGAR